MDQGLMLGVIRRCFSTLALSPSPQMDVIFFMVLFMDLNIQIDSLFSFSELVWGIPSLHTLTST